METSHVRVLTLQIHKETSGLYLAEVLWDRTLVTDPERYVSITEAIQTEAGAVPEGFAYFMEIRYQDLSSGTMSLENARLQAREVADRLVSLAREVYLTAGA
uniref:Uncharacterized protein n=1 Tax=Hydrogenophaga sp. PL2G6 TaxID=503997 RepID=B4Y317_9BURK|nr:hypothetical protein [Hydrogenophaga sp. PL2G6]